MKRTPLSLALLAVLALGAQAHAQATKPADKRQAPAAAQKDPAFFAAVTGPLMDTPEAVRPDLQRFYALRGYERVWTKDAQGAFARALADAQRHGLDARDFLDPQADLKDPVARELALTTAALSYARALALGRVDPTEMEGLWELKRNAVDAPLGLDQALKTGDFGGWFAGLAPSDRGYTGLSTAYLHYLDLVARGGWPAFAPGAPMKPGDTDARVPALVQRLMIEGDLEQPVEGEIYDTVLAEAVKKFQARHGLAADGVIGRDTQTALATTAQDRARQIALNLERRRWLPRQLAPERIEVNTAAAIMVYWRDGQPVDARRVVVGTSKNQTPSLEKPFNSLVANPPWYVPAGIAAKEILPKGPEYLAKENMYVTADGRVIQRAGPGAALGLVKFELQDSYAIYLHDTPSKSTFNLAKRHKSHGCVRVHDAIEFARLLLSVDPLAAQKFEEQLASGETKRVELSRSIPVRLLYWTAFVNGQGQVAFREDVYGRDMKLAQALGLDVKLPGASAEDAVADDVGP
ncbi:MAG TPA: L,D-transpeptidase family protein [Caulobacteraceae bacterium]|nr:L,D-transpeptidase family protein [Caulobacteraceae bacterium]